MDIVTPFHDLTSQQKEECIRVLNGKQAFGESWGIDDNGILDCFGQSQFATLDEKGNLKSEYVRFVLVGIDEKGLPIVQQISGTVSGIGNPV